MVLKKLLHSFRHFGRLGRVAATRSFLIREKKKLLLKLGDKTYELMHQGKLRSEELSRLVGQVEKIQGLLQKEDYGGATGADFDPQPKTGRRRPAK